MGFVLIVEKGVKLTFWSGDCEGGGPWGDSLVGPGFGGGRVGNGLLGVVGFAVWGKKGVRIMG